MTPVSASSTAIMALRASSRTAVIIVAVQAGTHSGGRGAEPRAGTSETLGRVGAGETAIVTGLAGLIHTVIKVADGTDAVLVDGVELALESGVAGAAVVGPQAGRTGILAFHAGYGYVVVVVVLSAGAPAAHHRTKSRVAGGALLAAIDAGQAAI